MPEYRIPVFETFCWQPTVLATQNTPPGSPVKGDRYIIGGNPTDAWTGYAQYIATYTGTGWEFDQPSEGWIAYDTGADVTRRFNGTAWQYDSPPPHASSHQNAGGDAIKLDDFAAPDDNTDLNATVGAHGLLPKLGGGTANFLRADGTWNAPTPAAHNLLSATHGDTATGTPVLGDTLYANNSPAWAKLSGNSTTTKQFLSQTGNGSISAAPAWGTIAAGDLPNHATRHQSGGADPVKLDDLATPDDNTDLNATTGYHGLLPKLGGGTGNFLRADGTWAAPTSGTTLTYDSSYKCLLATV